jgi:hypothetical protein
MHAEATPPPSDASLREVRNALERLDTGRCGQCKDCQRLSEATSGGRQVHHG